MTDLALQLRGRIRLFALINGAAILGWRVGEAMAAHMGAGAGFILSGIGMALWIVSVIVLFGQGWHARKAGVFDLVGDAWARRLHRDALAGAAAGAALGYGLAMLIDGTGAERLTLPLAGAAAGFLFSWVALDVRRHGRG
ncbi:hypothetical protein F1654_01440 [Alkalicaulis satelles]|uniref:Uncharacterized protein n=1 Tax=Alkalicaulis satelles TaxID=2609175 RepID=A0A5M6ZLS9_9PROT|nr:hypothetical protein [Alkalicaulis satelles]KAA5804694.1 hypothetical protein F1654_01440 [Alkalicaulis satelles]